MTLKLQENKRMVLVNSQEGRAGKIPRCLPSCEDDFVFNDGNGTTKEKAFVFSVVRVVPKRCSCFVCNIRNRINVFGLRMSPVALL